MRPIGRRLAEARRSIAIAVALPLLFACRSTEPHPVPVAASSNSATSWSAAARARTLGLEPSTPPADGVPILVVDEATRVPVADALVVAVDEDRFTYPGETFEECGAETRIRQLGTAYVTAADGRTRIRASNAPLTVLVFHGERFGRTTLEVFDRAEQSIPIGPRELSVEVVDAEGRPQAGVPLALAFCASGPDGLGAWRGVTGANGRVAIPALALERDVHLGCCRQAVVTFDFPSTVFAVRPIDAPRFEPVRLVLPECGSLDVEVVDAKGRPFAGRTSLLVEPTPRDRSRARRFGAACRFAYLVPRGRLEIPRVEVGMRLELESTDGSGCSERVTIVGPTRAGEHKRRVFRTASGEGAAGDDGLRPADAPAPHVDLDTPPPSCSSVELSVVTDERIDPFMLPVLWGNDPESESGPLVFISIYASLLLHGDVANPWIRSSGQTSIRYVAPGRWTFAIELNDPSRAEPITLWKQTDVEVGEAEHLRDPRLQRIDLRGRLRRHSFDVVDEAGHPLEGRILFRDEHDAVLGDPIEFRNGRYEFVTTPDHAARLTIAADRFVSRTLIATSAQERIVMQRGHAVRVVLDPGFVRPSDPELKLSVAVSERSFVGLSPDDSRCDEARDVDVEPGDSARFEIPEAGERFVLFTLRRIDPRDPDREISSDRFGATEHAIAVEERDGEQRFVVSPDPEGLARAIDEVVHEEEGASDG